MIISHHCCTLSLLSFTIATHTHTCGHTSVFSLSVLVPEHQKTSYSLALYQLLSGETAFALPNLKRLTLRGEMQAQREERNSLSRS